MTLYLIFQVCFHISVNQFVSKLVILRVWIFTPDITFFSALFNIFFECVVTLGMVTGELNYFKIYLEPGAELGDATAPQKFFLAPPKLGLFLKVLLLQSWPSSGPPK